MGAEALLGETEPRLFRVRLDCWGVGERRGLGGGLAGGEGRWRRRGGLAEGDRRRVLRGGLDTGLLGGFFGGERERDEDEEELLPDSEAEERLLLQNPPLAAEFLRTASQGICSSCAWVGEAFSGAGSSCAGTAGAGGWVSFLTVICGAFWVENEMENGIWILTWTWTETGISDESSPSPSLSPSLNYVLVKFP